MKNWILSLSRAGANVLGAVLVMFPLFHALMATSLNPDMGALSQIGLVTFVLAGFGSAIYVSRTRIKGK